MNGTPPAPTLVLGATGAVGAGLVAGLLQAGRPVLAVGRDPDRLAALAARLPDAELSLLRGSVADDRAAARLAIALRKRAQRPQAIVASLSGPLASGRLLDRPSDALTRQLQTDLLPHLAAARHLLPLLAESGPGARYLMIGGPAHDRPWAGYGHASIATAAARMLAKALHEEAQAFGVRVQMLSVPCPVSTPDNRRDACKEWPSVLALGRHVAALLDRPDSALRPVLDYLPHTALPGASHIPYAVTTTPARMSC